MNATATNSMNELPAGYALEQDQDGDWVLLPPENVTIVSVPGEGLLIGTCDLATAKSDAFNYLAALAA